MANSGFFLTVVFVVIVFLSPGLGVASGESLGRPPRSAVWRSARMCAVNSLYFLLQLRGVDVDYSQLQRELLHRHLASLEDIRQAAARRGVTVQVAKLTRDDLEAVPLPLIAHLEPVTVSGASRGHFVVIFDMDNHGPWCMDGTTAEVRHVPWRTFLREWSGYGAYVSGKHNRIAMRALVILAAGAACGIACAWMMAHRWRVRLGQSVGDE